MAKNRLRVIPYLIADDYAAAFFAVARKYPKMSIGELHRIAVDFPAPRVYCSLTQALKIIRPWMTNPPKQPPRNPKERMYRHIFTSTVAKIKEIHRPLDEILELVLDSPAPSFFIMPRTGRVLISRYLTKHKS